MVTANEDPKETAFTVSVDLKGPQLTTGLCPLPPRARSEM